MYKRFTVILSISCLIVIIVYSCGNINEMYKKKEEEIEKVYVDKDEYQKKEENNGAKRENIQGENVSNVIKETKLPLDNTHYYYETGIWDFWLDCQGNPETLARNDDTGELMLLSWKKKRQEERKFPLRQNKNTDHKNFFPCKYENMEGYFSYQGNVRACLVSF